MFASLYLGGSASARFVSGDLAELEDLFGSPLPDLPALERDEGQGVYLVHVHARLQKLLQRFIEAQLGKPPKHRFASGPCEGLSRRSFTRSGRLSD